MNTVKIAWGRIVGFLLLGVFSVLSAQPVYTTTVFDGIQEVTDDATLYFGVIVVLAILVTGFFLGRRWLKSAS